MAAQQPRGADDALAPALVLALIAVAAGACYGLWLAGQLAGLLSTGAWPRVRASPWILPDLLAHRTALRRVWPRDPTWLLVAIMVLLLAGVCAAGFAALRWWLGRQDATGASWGRRAVEKRLVVPEQPERRVGQLVVGRGRSTGRLLAGAAHRSVVVFGVPGKFKTTGFVIPNAMEWVGPTVVTTTKASDLDDIRAARPDAAFWVIAPAGLPGRATHQSSPVDYCTGPREADRMARWLAEASSHAGDRDATVWTEQAIPILKGLLLAAHLSGEGIEQFRTWLTRAAASVDAVVSVLRSHGYADVADDFAAPWSTLHADGAGSVQLTMNVIARVYSDEEARASAQRTDVTAKQLLDTGGTLCLVSPQSDVERYAPLFTTLIASIVHEAEDRYRRTGKPLDPPLAMLVDEAGNFLRYRGLAGSLTTGRAQGVSWLTIWHDLSQLRAWYGERDANTVLSASEMRVLLPGVGDPATLEYFATTLGQQHANRASFTRGGDGQRSHSTQIVETALAPVDQLRQLPDGQAVLEYSNIKPLRARIRTWFDDPRLRPLVDAARTSAAPEDAREQPA